MKRAAGSDAGSSGRLSVTRLIAASPERLFNVWTSPRHIEQWWGPANVECPYAEVDLRPGGAYRIANRLADGTVIWISGEFETVEPPSLLVYSWRTGDSAAATERVTVRFTARGEVTQVTVEHELITDEETQRSHESGWQGCLDGLAEYVKNTS